MQNVWKLIGGIPRFHMNCNCDHDINKQNFILLVKFIGVDTNSINKFRVQVQLFHGKQLDFISNNPNGITTEIERTKLEYTAASVWIPRREESHTFM